jgi:hypothetical protein
MLAKLVIYSFLGLATFVFLQIQQCPFGSNSAMMVLSKDDRMFRQVLDEPSTKKTLKNQLNRPIKSLTRPYLWSGNHYTSSLRTGTALRTRCAPTNAQPTPPSSDTACRSADTTYFSFPPPS